MSSEEVCQAVLVAMRLACGLWRSLMCTFCTKKNLGTINILSASIIIVPNSKQLTEYIWCCGLVGIFSRITNLKWIIRSHKGDTAYNEMFGCNMEFLVTVHKITSLHSSSSEGMSLEPFHLLHIQSWVFGWWFCWETQVFITLFAGPSSVNQMLCSHINKRQGSLCQSLLLDKPSPHQMRYLKGSNNANCTLIQTVSRKCYCIDFSEQINTGIMKPTPCSWKKVHMLNRLDHTCQDLHYYICTPAEDTDT